MAAKKFTNEEKQILRNNPYVESVENTRVIYTEEFKVFYMRNYLAGKKPTEIFRMAGFDPAVMGNKRIERASARWRKLYADGMLNLGEAESAAPQQEAAAPAQEADTKKKRRGRPKKKDVVKEEAAKEEAAPKKRRGRPRKNTAAETKSEYAAEVKAEEKPVEAPKKRRKKRVNKIALMAQNIKIAQEEAKAKQASDEAEKAPAVEAKTEVKAEAVKAEEPVAAPKKRRGRPRKNAAVQSAPVETAKAEGPVAAPKKRRGRPRKVVAAPAQAVKPEAAKVVQTTSQPQTVVQAQDPTLKQLVSALKDLMEEVHLLRGELALSNKK